MYTGVKCHLKDQSGFSGVPQYIFKTFTDLILYKLAQQIYASRLVYKLIFIRIFVDIISVIV